MHILACLWPLGGFDREQWHMLLNITLTFMQGFISTVKDQECLSTKCYFTEGQKRVFYNFIYYMLCNLGDIGIVS